MKLFKDIEFKTHPNKYIEDGLQGELDLGDGLELSVVQGGGLYGSADENTWEIAVFNTNEKRHMMLEGEKVDMGKAFIPLSKYDDVLGHLTPDEIDTILIEIQENTDKFLKKKATEKEEFINSLED